MNDSKTFFRPSALGERWGVSNSTIRRWAREGALPKPTIFSKRIFGWSLAVVEQVEKQRAGKGAK